jgi:hypothetical protein
MCRKNHRSSDPASRLQKCERDNLLAGRSRNPAVEAMVILTHPDRWLGSETRKDTRFDDVAGARAGLQGRRCCTAGIKTSELYPVSGKWHAPFSTAGERPL